MSHEFATGANLVECRDCGAMFNLDGQMYYDDLCPECKAERDGPESTWPRCPVCGQRYDPDGETFAVTVPNRGVRGGRERLTTCSAECRDDVEMTHP